MNRKRWLIFFLLPVMMVFYPAETEQAFAANTEILGYGSRGASVTELQRKLNHAGYYPEGIISGYFGSLTLQAVKRMEQKNGLVVDGKVGQAEWAVLDKKKSGLSKVVMGFYTEDYPGDKLSYNSLKANGQLIDQVATFDYQVNGSGGLVGKVSPEGLAMAKSKGTAIVYGTSPGSLEW